MHVTYENKDSRIRGVQHTKRPSEHRYLPQDSVYNAA